MEYYSTIKRNTFKSPPLPPKPEPRETETAREDGDSREGAGSVEGDGKA